jgi:hypothetical protein
MTCRTRLSMGSRDHVGGEHDIGSGKEFYGTPNQGSHNTAMSKCRDDHI